MSSDDSHSDACGGGPGERRSLALPWWSPHQRALRTGWWVAMLDAPALVAGLSDCE